MDNVLLVLAIILNVLIFILQLAGKICVLSFWFIAMIICAEVLVFLCSTLFFGFIISGYRHWVVDTAVPGLARATASCFRKLFNIEETIPQFLKKDGTPDMRYKINRNF